jgi:hypothetical protein
VELIPTDVFREKGIGELAARAARRRPDALHIPERDVDGEILDRRFCESVARALDLIRRLMPHQYAWLIANVTSIRSLPIAEESRFYSESENRIYLNPFVCKPANDKGLTDWDDVWLAAAILYFAAEARIYKRCPCVLLADPDRADRFRRNQARLLCKRATVDPGTYDFTTLGW